MNKSKLSILILFMFFSLRAVAILPFEDAAYPELITSARALGMGNAYLGKVDDSWSSFYNPAGLGTVRRGNFHLTNVHLEGNNGLNDAISGSGVFDTPGNFLDALAPEGIDSLIQDEDKILVHSKLSAYPNITFRYFSIGYVYSQSARARIDCSTCDREFAYRKDMGPLAAFNVSLFGGILKVGVSAVYLTREQFQKDFTTGSPYFISNNSDVQKANILYVTTGMRLTLPVSYLLTFSAVLRNSADSKWEGITYSGAPTDIPQTIDGSISVTPQIGRSTRVHLEVVLRDINNGYPDTDNARKLGAGMEFDFIRKYFVRFGYSDGWGSFGLGVRGKGTVFDFATYARESGTGFRDEEDRRWVFSWASGF